tara:strand:- start:5232 stop:6248 length:1017 start_codon:yes stop_codon:yes gene_type:complete
MSLFLYCLFYGGFANSQASRDYISIVGSSTVYPFTTVAAERYGRSTNFKTPKVESTGSGGGLKLFCGGIGAQHPDITNSSRAIKDSEIRLCAENGISEIIEVKIGYDGIVLSNSLEAKSFNLTLKEIFLALAKNIPDASGKIISNPYQKWNEINPKLPDQAIEIMGPPPTSGTRDAFVELAMEGGCKAFSSIRDLKNSNGDRYKSICHGIREDGAFIEAGENDNLIIQKLETNPNALGIFGYSFLDQNNDKVKGTLVDSVEPTFENIAEGSYPISRPLYFYVKKAHVGVIPGLKEFLREFTSERAWGEDGYLSDRGLIPMPDEERFMVGEAVNSLTAM